MKYSNIECPSQEYLQHLIKHKKLIRITIRASMGENPIIGVPIDYIEDTDNSTPRPFQSKILWCYIGGPERKSKSIDINVISIIKQILGVKALIWKLENNM